MRKILYTLAVFTVLIGCQSSFAADTTVYAKITGNVRSVTLMDENGGIIGKRFEKRDFISLKWFEAYLNSDGIWKFTDKGLSDKEEVNASSGGEGGEGSEGGGC